MGPPWFAILLVIVFYFCVCLEFLFPTAGMAGLLAVVTFVSALVISFTHSIGWGIGITVFVVATTPPLMMGLVRIWPFTPMGRRILNRRPDDAPYQPPTSKTRRGTDYESLIGHRGVALSDLLPSGQVIIDGERINAISLGEVIDKGSDVIVIETKNRHLQVRLAKPEDDKTIARPSTEAPASINTSDENGPTSDESSPTTSSPPALEISLDELDE